jgi:deoxycytidine triphosphate deaminase
MIIGLDILMNRVTKGELIKNLSARELAEPEGAGFDLRARELYRIVSSGFLGCDERDTAQAELISSYSEGSSNKAVLKPGEFYLVRIIEEISLDDDMIGIFHPRSTLFRSGVVLQTGIHPPGYSGAPTFGIYVAGRYPFTLEMGARIAHVNILRVEGKTNRYRGQWQGGRVTTQGLEKQR